MKRHYIFMFNLLCCLLALHIKVMAQPNLPILPTGNDDDFVIVAHRGASAYAPENTISAFKLAIEMKAEMIELDITLSKDGIPVVIHDKTVNRTTPAEGKVSDFTLAELKTLDVGSWFDEQFAGEPFPTLEEVLAIAKGIIAVNIEIKGESVTDEAKGGIVDKAVQLVKAAEMEREVLFSSFDYRVMEHLNELAPEISKAVLYEKSQSEGLLPSQLVEKYKLDAFNLSHRQLTDEWVKDLTSHQIPFFVYTVNDPELMKELIRKGATGIISDKPDVLKSVVENL